MMKDMLRDDESLDVEWDAGEAQAFVPGNEQEAAMVDAMRDAVGSFGRL